MTTEEIIADLRQNGLTSASIYTRMERAANRLEELQRQLEQALAERTPHDYGLLKNGMFTARKEAFEARKERDEANALTQELKKELNYALAELHQARGNARPEPSRLEIAAMIYAADISGGNIDTTLDPDMCPFNALDHADALIRVVKGEAV